MDPTLPVAPESRRPERLDADHRLDAARLPPPVDVVLQRAALESGLHPRTCPQCGINAAGAAKPRTFQWVTPWVYLAFLANILILAILYLALRVRVTAVLPLCPDCDRADRRGRLLTALSYWGVILGPLAFAIAGALVDDALGLDIAGWASLVGFVAGLVGAVVTTLKLRPQVIQCRRIDKKAGSITLRASPSWRPVLEREEPAALFGVGR